jgi:hypothetical protein
MERKRFKANWKDFIASDPHNKKIYKINGNILSYKSEQLIPTKIDPRPPLLLVLGNPTAHSVESGMFFSFRSNAKEQRFWKSILQPAGVLELPFEPGLSIAKLNQQRRDDLFNLNYDSPYRIGLSAIISMPGAPGGPWGGVAGVQKLLGAKAMRRLEQWESKRVLGCAKTFVTDKGAVIAFQKNAWNNLRCKNDPHYQLTLARSGKLKGHLIGNPNTPLFCVPPTRLCSPCSQILKKLVQGYFLQKEKISR